jgi:starch synthase
MKVLFVSSECAPFAKVGGLADFIASLPKELKNFGLDVRICLPLYQKIKKEKWNLKLISNFYLNKERVFIWQGFLPKTEIPIYFLENERYLSKGEIYPPLFDFEGIKRFLFFSKAVLETFKKIDWQPDIIHCNEWETAFIAPLLKIEKSKIKNLLTIHNLSIQGKWNAKDIFNFLKLKGEEIESLKIRDRDGDLNILEQGILNSDIVTTVSPTYSKEILTKEYGEGLEEDLRKKKPIGILNGIDDEFFNPETDPNLKANYSSKDFENKKINKIDLQEILTFKKDEKIPLAGFVSRLVEQKGLDLFEKIIPDLARIGLQLVFLGVGEEKYERMLLDFSKKYPKNVSANIKFDPILAQKIYGGCDIVLIPSLFEPCGLTQMIAMRYGTIPVARKTGGLNDTIEDGKTGFLFENYDAKSFLEAIKRCLKIYNEKEKWQKMTKEAMKKDFSWKKSAREYLKIYQNLIENERKL